jgi:hypothetical protein
MVEQAEAIDKQIAGLLHLLREELIRYAKNADEHEGPLARRRRRAAAKHKL